MDTLQAFYIGLANIMPFSAAGQDPFLFMLIGIAIGFVVGILPGLGGATTLALMLPFIYKMDPTTAFAFLLGSNAVTATTGDITSILFGVPGEGITAATIVDGHPMAKKGEAGRALGAALMSSLVGAVFGAFALALAIPIVQPLVLSIGSSEFFMLALLGITFVASLSGGNMSKGLCTGAFGLVLATIGLDPIESVPRFTLDPLIGEDAALFLWDGLSLVSVTVGLFAIPEIIELSVQGSSIARQSPTGKLGGVMQGIMDTFRHWKLVLACSAIGSYIGLIPGLGGGPAQWVAYAHAVQSSPGDKSRFGKGAIEGVLGPGAANNSKEGGSLVPTIAFGVPGSVSMAILLGAFIIQGIVPGPDLLDPAKHLNLTFSFVWIIVVSNIITVAVCLLFLNQLAKITLVKGTFLIPFLLLLIYLGGFAVNNAFGDMLMVLIFGAVGWLMVRFDWQRPPLLLGLVLGGIAENNLFIATKVYGVGFMLRPGVLLISLLILAGLFYPMFQAYRERKRAERHEAAFAVPGITKTVEAISRNERMANGIFAFCFVALFAYVLRECFFGFGADEERAALFPVVVGLPAFVISAVVFVKEIMKTTRVVVHGEEGVEEVEEISPQETRRRTAAISAWVVGFFLSIWLLGFVLSSLVATFLYLKFGAGERWPITIILTAAAYLFFAGIFDRMLHLPFPTGDLFVWLGLE